MARPKSPLTNFILSMPTLSAKEVVAKAKERGLETSEKNVHRVRSLPKGLPKGPGAKKTFVAASATSATRKGASPNKSAFVRGLPSALHPREVVAKAKAAGMTLTEKHVQVIRSKAKQAPPPKRVVAAAAAPSKRVGPAAFAKGAKTTLNKAEFVRSLPATTPAKEVTQRAKAAGLSIAVEYVYKVRAKKGAKPKAVVASKPVASKASNGNHATKSASAPSSSKHLEQIFIGAALDMGLARAAEILDTVRAKVRAFTA